MSRGLEQFLGSALVEGYDGVVDDAFGDEVWHGDRIT
jgi:hypothetical protein